MTFDAYLPADRRRALAVGEELPTVATGTVLFADVSGFTPLTEALVEELGPRRGAERLTSVLDLVLGALIDEVERVQGAVVYFSGDAITVWLDGDDGTRAVGCGDAMQATMQEVGQLEVGDQVVTLGLKVAVASGTVRRFVVGDPDVQLVDVLAGAPLDAVAAAEGHAEPGQVVVTRPVLAVLGDRAQGAVMVDDVAVLAPLAVAPDLPPAPAPVHLADEDAASWVLPQVRERLGDGAMVAELRRVLPVFVRFGGIDFDDEAAPAQVDAFVTGVQRVLADHGGALLQLTVGDKGAYLYGVFGAPVAHEDDPVRAVAACLAVQDEAARTGVEDVRIGISHGRVFSGVHGHARRRTFVCLGDPVNLAARIMGKAAPGEVVVAPDVRRAVGTGADWEDRPPVALKGKAEPVSLSRVLGLHASSRRAAGADRTPFVGRDPEFAQLSRLVDGTGALRVVAVTGAAGAGKTRLVREVTTRATDRGRPVVQGTASAVGRTAPYQVWQPVGRELLGIEPDTDAVSRIRSVLAGLDERLVDRAPLLGPLLGVELPETAVTRGMDARVRRASREDLVVRLLAARDGPAPVLVLEDAHAVDELSLDLVRALQRARDRLDVTLLLVSRPPGEGDSDVAGVADEVLDLEPLDEQGTDRLLEHHATLRFGADVEVHPALRRLVLDRAQGNPLTVAELVRSLADRGVDPTSPPPEEFDLPASLEALVLARVDRLADLPRRTIKIASVMLRSFRPATLTEVHPELGADDEVRAALDSMVGELLVREDGDRYDLRHALTREVAYGSLPFSLRSRLHDATGRRVERRHAEELAPQYDVLAHHFWHGESPDRRERYQRLAGAAAKTAYANEAALTYLDRLVEVTEGTAQVDALLDRAEVRMLVGRLDDAVTDQEAARAVAADVEDDHAAARVRAALAETARRAGHFDEAVDHLGAAGAAFEELGDDAGRARVLHLTGTISAQRGDLEAAERAYQQALAIREDIGDVAGRAALLNNLGIVAEYSGDLEASASLHERALALREEVGDPWGVANSHTNIGQIALLRGLPGEARQWFELALDGNERIGDTWQVALSHHNLGNALRDLGEHREALAEYGAAAGYFLAADDEWALALLLEDGAGLAAATGNGEVALELLGTADRLREELASPRNEQLVAAIGATIESTAVAEHEAAMRRAHGHARPVSEAITVLLHLSHAM